MGTCYVCRKKDYLSGNYQYDKQEEDTKIERQHHRNESMEEIEYSKNGRLPLIKKINDKNYSDNISLMVICSVQFSDEITEIFPAKKHDYDDLWNVLKIHHLRKL